MQTAAVMERFEPVLLRERPDWVLVVGDVNSMLDCALVCAKLGVRVAHVEAGLRSRDRSMPDEWAWKRLSTTDNLRLVEPLGYLDFLHLYCGASLVLTDSGGIQEETRC